MLHYPELDAPAQYLAPDVDDTALGNALRNALAASKRVSIEEFQKIFTSGAIQKLGEERTAYVMKQYGYKARRALYKNMMCCWITQVADEIVITPTHHKTIDTYSGISIDGPEIQRLKLDASDAELGAALREGFSRCTSSF